MIERENWIMSSSGIRLRREGVFDIKAIYDTIKDYFAERKYDLYEKENQTKDKPKGYEVTLKFNAERKVDDYARFHINTEFLLIGAEKVSVKGKKLDKGFIEIIFKAYIQLDYRQKWTKNRFSKFLNFIYNNYIIKNKIKTEYEGKLYGDLINYHDLIKERLEFYVQ